MPCSDVTDFFQIILTPDYKIQTYLFCKRTCGGAVGEDNLLQDWVEGKTLEEILNADVEDLISFYKPKNQEEGFLLYKHLKAICTVLGVFLGYEEGGLESHCTIGNILYLTDQIQIEAHLKVKTEIKNISACGGCGSGCGTGGGCGSNKGLRGELEGSNSCGCSPTVAELLGHQSKTSKRLKLLS